MLFRLEITNVSDLPIEFEYLPISRSVCGPDGNRVKHVDWYRQIGMSPKIIKAGETIIFADKYDITSEYPIVKPGRYAFQWGLKPSDIIEMDVKPGELSPADSIVERLMKVLPEGWELTQKVDSSNQTIVINLIGRLWRKATEDRGVGLFIYINPSASCTRGELLGQTKWGTVYVSAYDAKLLWPDYKEQIIKALDIQEIKPH